MIGVEIESATQLEISLIQLEMCLIQLRISVIPLLQISRIKFEISITELEISSILLLFYYFLLYYFNSIIIIVQIKVLRISILY